MSIYANLKLPKVIYEVPSEFNGNIQVWESGDTRKLVVDGTVQSVSVNSPSARRMVFGQISEVIKEHAPEMKNIFILGLAGGTLQQFIHQDFPEASITSVEIDPVMVDVANKYFDLEKIPNHKVIVEDACRVIIEPEEHGIEPKSFDVAVVDIYIGQKFPDLGKSGNFLTALKKLIEGGGLVVFNRIYLDSHQEEVDIFMDQLSGFFSELDSVTVAGKTNSDNIIIFGRA